MNIVIPLGSGSNWQNNELRYCLRSLQENCKFYFNITILAEPGCRPDWLIGVEYKEITRYYPEGLAEEYGDRLYENYFSNLYKYYYYSNLESTPERFAIAYDDQLLIRPISSFDCFEGVALCPDKSNKLDKRKRTRHENTILQALELAHAEKHHNGLYNYETHCIRIYQKDLLQRLFYRYPFQKMKIPYSLATLYGNIYIDNPTTLIRDEDTKIIAYLHFEDGTCHHYVVSLCEELNEIVNNYTMLSYNDRGLLPEVKDWIMSKFNTKSRFEI